MSALTVLSSEELDQVAGGWGSYTYNSYSNNNWNSNNNFQKAFGVNVIGWGGVSSGSASVYSSSGNQIITGSN
ncbi:MAG: hypothetical protein AB7S57_20250 [Acetobacteraceae bacterium]